MGGVVEQDIDEIINVNPELVKKLADKAFLVTGSTGMIGRYIVGLLAEIAKRHKSKATIVANARNKDKAEQMFGDYLDMEGFKLLIGDVNDITKLDDDVDYIIQAASPTQPHDFLDRPVDIIKANVFATNNLLEVARAKSARFCFLSTLEIYGKVEAEHYPVSVTESDFGALNSLDLRSAYPESKRLAENLCVAFQKQFGVASTIVRLGPVMSPVIEPGDKRILADLINDAVAGRDITFFSDSANKERTYTYITDAVTGIFTALLASTDDDFVFNLANSKNRVSIRKLAETISSRGSHATKLNIVKRDGDQNTSTATGVVLLDAQKLLSLGWVPRYSLADSIERTIANMSNKL